VKIDHRKLPRRRGEVLNAAIYQATLDQLIEVGYAKLTMERVAERAGTGKATLYRRWNSRMELVLDAVAHHLPEAALLPDTGSLRGDLLALLRQQAEVLAGPVGEAMRALLSDALRDQGRIAELRQHARRSDRHSLRLVVYRAVDRGEVDIASVTAQRLEVGRAMICQYFLFDGVPIADRLITEVVDEVLLPLFRASAPSR
jgi:AcrR family transcriptional regulator